MTAQARVDLNTGAGRGIGRVIASRFAAQGDRVALHYHCSRDSAAQALAALAGGPHARFEADIADIAQATALVPRVVEHFGWLDVLVNNAGIYRHHPILDIAAADWAAAWQRTLSTNLLGAAQLTHGAARHMAAHGGGRIINISSRSAFRGEPQSPAYAASKAALNAMTQSLAVELAPHQVYLYAVAPGWVATEMSAEYLDGPQGEAIRRESPLGRVARPEDVAHVVEFLAGEGSEFLTGDIIDVNGASYLRS